MQSDERQAFVQVTNRLQTALSRDRKIRLLKALLSGVAAGGLAATLAGFAAPQDVPHWTAAGVAIGALAGAGLLWRDAPRLLDLARRADRQLATDAAIETAVEGWAKGTPLNDMTRLLRDRVETATQNLHPAALVPLDLARPALAAALGVALACVAPLLPLPAFVPAAQAISGRAVLEDGLGAIAALRDSADTRLGALGAQAEALRDAIANGADPAALIPAMAALQADTAALLAAGTADTADLAALAAALSRLDSRTAAGDPAPEDAAPPAANGSAEDDKNDPQDRSIDPPASAMVTVPSLSPQGTIEDDTLSCEFGDEPSCTVRAEGERPAVQNSYDEDIPEQIGPDSLTRGGEPNATIASAGDTGATGLAEAAFYGEAAPVSTLEAGFSDDILTLSADNPMAAGRRGRRDSTAEFGDGVVTRFPDAPVVGQPDWQRAPEHPVVRMPIDPALGQALRNYYPAPEAWR